MKRARKRAVAGADAAASHRLAVPFIGLNQVLAAADVLLAAGTRMVGLRNRTVAPPPGVPLIRIDADGTQFYRTTSPAVGIVADAKPALSSLVDLVPSQNRSRPDRSAGVAAVKRWVADDMDTLQPRATWGRTLREERPEETIFVTESTQMATG